MKTKEIGHVKTKEEITELLNSNDLTYFPVTYHGCKGLFIPASDSESCRTYPGISVTMCNKDIYRVYPYEILYIAIEDRKSVMYLTNRKLETFHPIEHWKMSSTRNPSPNPITAT